MFNGAERGISIFDGADRYAADPDVLWKFWSSLSTEALRAKARERGFHRAGSFSREQLIALLMGGDQAKERYSLFGAEEDVVPEIPAEIPILYQDDEPLPEIVSPKEESQVVSAELYQRLLADVMRCVTDAIKAMPQPIVQVVSGLVATDLIRDANGRAAGTVQRRLPESS